MSGKRQTQTGYSEMQPRMLDEESRRLKAQKIVAVLTDFLGKTSLSGLHLLDIGCSGGIISGALAHAGAVVTGVDIDEPALRTARDRAGPGPRFVLTDGHRLPIRSGAMDVVVLNHIYEHVLDPVTLVTEIRRVLAPGGVAYLGLGNRLGVMEPHYRLPFLSWVTPRVADVYVRAFRRADHYHERFLTRRNLRRLFADLFLWDYTYTIMAEPERFNATDIVPQRMSRLIAALSPAIRDRLIDLIPTYIWVGTLSETRPAGPAARVPPQRLGQLRRPRIRARSERAA